MELKKRCNKTNIEFGKTLKLNLMLTLYVFLFMNFLRNHGGCAAVPISTNLEIQKYNCDSTISKCYKYLELRGSVENSKIVG